jgi:lysophospholipase L1-like esterase
MRVLLRSFAVLLLLAGIATPGPFFLTNGQRVVFLGDSITQDGRYVEDIEAYLIAKHPEIRIDVVKLGLSSETTEGLTEPDHPFPRPDIHDRLESALTKTRPDVVVACYGMNDGIYHPFSNERFKAYQDGVRKLIRRIQAAGATVVLVTPPPFEAVAAGAKVVGADAPKFGYETPYRLYDEEVLEPYGRWILGLRSEGLMAIDIHTPMKEEADRKRAGDPAFALAADGVHPGADGHWIMARAILEAWGEANPAPPRADVLGLIQQKWKVLGPAWLSRVGHKRNPPPVNFEEAQARAAEFEGQARKIASGAHTAP